jgi:D-arabinose 1-dehydrogenase-like Zn-dependent alcohol dehydrogenase
VTGLDTGLGTVPETGTAMLLPGVGEPLQQVTRPVTPPAPGEAVVRVDACGVCGSDAFLQQGGFGAEKLPVVPGHEAAGHVVAVGSEEDAEWLGRQVAIYYIDGPQDSSWARSGHENIGPDLVRMGVDADGAFADYVTRRIHTLVPVDPPLDPVAVAVATDALATPYHALTRIAQVRPGDTVAVLGLGGIGSNAVQIAKHLGARVVAVGRGAPKMELAERLGADVVVSSDLGAEEIRARAGGQVDVVLQCVGSPALDRLALDVAGYRARVVLVGTSLGRFDLASSELVWRELAVLGSRGFTRQDIAEVIDLVRDGTLAVDHLTARTLPLAQADQALRDLADPAVLRTVLVTGPVTGGTP